MGAGEDLDEGRLAGAVVADDRHDLAAGYGEIDIGNRRHRAEALGNAPRFDDGRGHVRGFSGESIGAVAGEETPSIILRAIPKER